VDHVRATTEGRLQPLRSFVMKSKSIDSCQQQQQLQMQGFITAGVKSEFERRGEKRKQLISIFFLSTIYLTIIFIFMLRQMSKHEWFEKKKKKKKSFTWSQSFSFSQAD
jgi:hypothetical protein